MPIDLICIGHRMPDWVEQGYQDYVRRLPKPWALRLTEIAMTKRTKNVDIARCKREEGKRMLALLESACPVVALDERGASWTTRELAEHLHGWLTQGALPRLLVGGPDGLDAACIQRAEVCWSLSALTLPHALVRVVVAEQVYRAWTLLQQHPYHRE